MCQEIHLTDVRQALRDYCDEQETVEDHFHVDDLLADFDDSDDQVILHVREHRKRAQRLAARGDRGAAHIHEALLANMARAAS